MRCAATANGAQGPATAAVPQHGALPAWWGRHQDASGTPADSFAHTHLPFQLACPDAQCQRSKMLALPLSSPWRLVLHQAESRQALATLADGSRFPELQQELQRLEAEAQEWLDLDAQVRTRLFAYNHPVMF